MDLFESWMRESQVSFEADIQLFSVIPLNDVTFKDWYHHERTVKSGVNVNVDWYSLVLMFRESLTSEEDRRKYHFALYSQQGVVGLAKQLMRERKEKLLSEMFPQDETVFKQGFMGALFGCDIVISPYEAIGRIEDRAVRSELAELHAEIEREYHEQLWTKMIDRIPKQTLISMISESRGIDLPENFPELMRLVPGVDPEYVESLRSADSKRLLTKSAET